MGRILEPEVMEDPEEVSAYSDAAAREHLEAIDQAFVEEVLELGVTRGLGLNVGTGPAQIPLKLLARAPELQLIAVDRGLNMLVEASRRRDTAALTGRLGLALADGRRLPFADRTFDLVICNSLIHHLADPLPVLAEMNRVRKPGGALLVADLRRPSPLCSWPHMLWHGRHYRGAMWRLFRDSVKAAFSFDELDGLVRRLGWTGAELYRRGGAHHGIRVRPRS